MSRIRLNDKVRFHKGPEVLVTGTVMGINRDEVLISEDHASSVWGESIDGAGTLHKVNPRELEKVDA